MMVWFESTLSMNTDKDWKVSYHRAQECFKRKQHLQAIGCYQAGTFRVSLIAMTLNGWTRSHNIPSYAAKSSEANPVERDPCRSRLDQTTGWNFTLPLQRMSSKSHSVVAAVQGIAMHMYGVVNQSIEKTQQVCSNTAQHELEHTPQSHKHRANYHYQ